MSYAHPLNTPMTKNIHKAEDVKNKANKKKTIDLNVTCAMVIDCRLITFRPPLCTPMTAMLEF